MRQGVRSYAELRGEALARRFSWRHVADAGGILRSYEAKRFGSAAWQEGR